MGSQAISVILAAGNQLRWKEEILFTEFPVKQLIDINGIPLIREMRS